MLQGKQSRVWFRVVAVFVLALGVSVLVSDARVVQADQLSDIEQCYNDFANEMDSAYNNWYSCRFNACEFGCQGNQACIASCYDECNQFLVQDLGTAITGSALEDGFSDCLMENVFFTPEMCPTAPEAAAVCDAAYQGCLSAVENIEDQQAAMSLAADCWWTWDQCVDASGYWDCQ